MFEQYFKTNEEAGALYGTEDLLQVRLQSDDLKSFLQNWDAVIAGKKRIPDENTLKDLFLRQLRKSRRMSYDLDVYDRSSDGSHQRSYTFLVQAVRDLLARERLKLNRERISKSNDMRYKTAASGDLSDSSLHKSPRRSPGSSNRGSGICFEFAKHGSCKHGSKCKYKDEKPRDRSNSPRGSRSSSRSSFHSSRSRRSSSGSSGRVDKSEIPCRYFKKGNCIHGDSCPFKRGLQPRHRLVNVPDHQQPSPKGARESLAAEVRGAGRVTKEIGVADVVETRVDRENHHPGAKVLKTAQVHHASIMHVLSSKMTTGKCPKADMLQLGIITSTAEMPCTHLAPSVRFRFACCPTQEQNIIKYQDGCDDLCIKDNWRSNNPDTVTGDWIGKSIFRLKNKHQVAMSNQRKKVFKVSFDRKVKTRTFHVEDDMVKHQHIKQSKSKMYPRTEDCPKSREADTVAAIRCAKSVSETIQVEDFELKWMWFQVQSSTVGSFRSLLPFLPCHSQRGRCQSTQEFHRHHHVPKEQGGLATLVQIRTL